MMMNDWMLRDLGVPLYHGVPYIRTKHDKAISKLQVGSSTWPRRDTQR